MTNLSLTSHIEAIAGIWGIEAGGPRLLLGVEADEDGNDKSWGADVVQPRHFDQPGYQDSIAGQGEPDFILKCKGGKTEAEVLENIKRALERYSWKIKQEMVKQREKQRELGVKEEPVQARTGKIPGSARKAPPVARKRRGRPPKPKVEDPEEDSADELNSSSPKDLSIKKQKSSVAPKLEALEASMSSSARVVDLTSGRTGDSISDGETLLKVEPTDIRSLSPPKDAATNQNKSSRVPETNGQSINRSNTAANQEGEDSPNKHPIFDAKPNSTSGSPGSDSHSEEDTLPTRTSSSVAPTKSTPPGKRKRHHDEVVEMDSDSSNIDVAIPEDIPKKRHKNTGDSIKERPGPFKSKKKATTAPAVPGVVKTRKGRSK